MMVNVSLLYDCRRFPNSQNIDQFLELVGESIYDLLALTAHVLPLTALKVLQDSADSLSSVHDHLRSVQSFDIELKDTHYSKVSAASFGMRVHGQYVPQSVAFLHRMRWLR